MDVLIDVLMRQAVDMKTAQLAENRRLYDSWRPWYRNSLFSREDVVAIRKVDDFQAKLAFVNDCRARGNDSFRAEDYLSAIVEYDRALSVWDWVESVLSDWKRQAIEDKDLRQKSFEPSSSEEVEVVRQSKVALLLNLALCYSKTLQYPDSIAACTSILNSLDPRCVKALYRRAMAYVSPRSSGVQEHLLALRDLKAAVELCPTTSTMYVTVSRVFEKVRRDLTEMRQSERKHFLHLFDRIDKVEKRGGGHSHSNEVTSEVETEEVCTTTPLTSSHPLLQASDVDLETLSVQLSDQILSIRRHCTYNTTSNNDYGYDYSEEESHIEELEERERAIQRLLAVRRQTQDTRKTVMANNNSNNTPYSSTSNSSSSEVLDFLHPSDKMIEEAKQFNIDLTDVRQRELLHEIKTMDDSSKSNTNTSSNNSRGSVDKAVLVRRLYEKEAGDVARIAMKGCDRHSMVSMLTTRHSNYTHIHSHLLPTTTSNTSTTTTLAERRRCTYTAEEVLGWSDEVVARRLEEELVADVALTYESFEQRASHNNTSQSEDSTERQEWSDAVVKTMLLYHESLAVSSNKSLFLSIKQMWVTLIRQCQHLLFPPSEKGKPRSWVTSSSLLQTIFIVLVIVGCRLIAKHLLFPYLS